MPRRVAWFGNAPASLDASCRISTTHSSPNGYRALLSSGFLDAKREASAIDTLLQLRADGLIMLGTMMTITRIKESASHIPVVVIGRKASARTMDSVRNDDDPAPKRSSIISLALDT